VRGPEKPLTIGEVAKAARVGVETVRFYEREGLIDPPARTRSGYRQYDREVVRRIRFIQHAKDLGFSLRQIGELLSLRAAPDGTCAAVRSHALAKIADIDGRIASLGAMRRALMRLADACAGAGPASECPFLEALDQENDHAIG
jgi:MerR family mercuric resistance operon transcriptional regulator